ncbi:MAG: NAD(P)H-hydrate epimerase [Planctomycetes bacterium]|nr:NAD(P)H-hydrate epimerase [Planctomycetota bacterium]
MNIPTLTRDQVRELDRRATVAFGVLSIVLMENAGRGLADRLMQLGPGLPGGKHVVICCGRGNNAGDGFVLARHLDLRGVPLRVLIWGDPTELKGDAATNYQVLSKSEVSVDIFADGHNPTRLNQLLADASWIVDALLGTGSHGAPRPPLDAVIRQLNAHAAPKVAVDLPSGLDCDSGEAADPTIVAAHTLTFVAHKPGFLKPGANRFTGEVQVLDIGAPRKLVENFLPSGP